MTEEQIERATERRMDALDRSLMAGGMSQADYDKAVKALDRWTEDQRQRNPGGKTP